jgi:hypoxanthine phosphoribosyltransferase
MEKICFTYEQIDGLIAILLQEIKDSGKHFSVVVGIKNGGTYISQKIASALELPLEFVRISHYDDTEFHEEAYVEHSGFNVCNYDRCLVIDDLLDSGKTLETFKKNYGLRQQDRTAVLFYKKNASVRVDFFAEYKPNEWCIFPWET